MESKYIVIQYKEDIQAYCFSIYDSERTDVDKNGVKVPVQTVGNFSSEEEARADARLYNLPINEVVENWVELEFEFEEEI